MRWPFPWPKSWRASGTGPTGPGEPKQEDEDETEDEPKSLKESAFLLARDVVLAFVVVGIVMLLLVAYARVWPPMVVVESGSMEHNSEESLVGAIDTGDLVLVQDVGTASDIVTYAEGSVQGYETYSNYGDVIVFYPPTVDISRPPTSPPIIHRAILYVTPNAAGGVDAPSLAAWPPNSWSGTDVDGQPASTPVRLRSITLLNVRSWDENRLGSRNPSWTISSQSEAGFLTKGDHNADLGDQWGRPGAVFAVPVSHVIGKARGELPWFGLIKLTVSPGNSGCCPGGWGDRLAAKNSWDSLMVSLVLLIVGPFVADYSWAWYAGRRKARRRAAREAKQAAEKPQEPIEQAGGQAPDSSAPSNAEGETPPRGDVTDEARTESSAPEGGAP